MISTLEQENTSIEHKKFDSFDEFKAFIKDTFINGSGIDEKLFNTCVQFYQSQEFDYGGEVSTPIHDELDWKFTRFGKQAQEQFYAALLKNEDGTTWQAIVSLWDEDKQRPYRYIAPKKPENAPKGYGNRAFLPPIPDLIRKRIGSKYGIDVPTTGSFWGWLETQDKLPRIITEGGKKALCGLSSGYIAIALFGCTCGVTDTDSNGARIAPKPIPDISRFAIENTCWLLAFDRDDKLSAKNAVSFGKKRLMGALTRDARCFVEDIFWKPEQGKGWDDLVIKCGDGAFDNAYSRAVTRLEKQFKSKGLIIEDIETGKKPPADKIAEKIAEDYRHILKYNNELRQWYRYEADYAGVWSPETDDYIESLIYQIIKSEGIEGYSANYIASVTRLMRHELICRKWQERTDLLPFINGCLDVNTGKLLPHNPNYHITWQLPREYSSEAGKWETIDNFLNHLSNNNPHIKNILLCYCNAVIKGRSDLQKFLHLIGIGGSGKGSFSRLVFNLIGEQNVLTTTLEDWCNNQFEGANAYGKRLVLFPDEDKQTGRLGKFLNLTGDDLIRAEEKGKKAFQYRYRGMVLVLSNFPIFTGDGANRIKRRAVTVPCNNPVTTINLRLEQDFESELSAFTNYLVSIPDATVTDTLMGIEKVTECTLEFWENRTQVDSIAAWLNQHVIYDPTAETPVGFDKTEGESGTENYTLFGSYNKHCRAVGDAAKSHKRFTPELLELCKSVLGWKVERRVTKTGKLIRGLRLRRSQLDDDTPTYDYHLMQKISGGMPLEPSPSLQSLQGIHPEPSPYPSPNPSPLHSSDLSGVTPHPDTSQIQTQIQTQNQTQNQTQIQTQNSTINEWENYIDEGWGVTPHDRLKREGDGSGDGLGDGSQPLPGNDLSQGDGLSPILPEIFPIATKSKPVRIKFASPVGEVRATATNIEGDIWECVLDVENSDRVISTGGGEDGEKVLRSQFKKWLSTLRFTITELVGVGIYRTVENCRCTGIKPHPNTKNTGFTFKTPDKREIFRIGLDGVEVMS